MSYNQNRDADFNGFDRSVGQDSRREPLLAARLIGIATAGRGFEFERPCAWMSDKMAWFPFFPADWMLDPLVNSMSLEQQAIYLRLLCVQWREGDLPADGPQLRKICGVELEAWVTQWGGIGGYEPVGAMGEKSLSESESNPLQKAFPIWEDGHRRNHRLNEIRNEKLSTYNKLRESGRAAARRRWGAKEGKSSDADFMGNPMRFDADPDPDTDTDKRPKPASRGARRNKAPTALVPSGDAVSGDLFRPLVKWSKISQSVEMPDSEYNRLKRHLAGLGKKEGLKRQLTNPELQESVGRLNGHLLTNPRKRGAKTLPGLVRNWLENDLRRKNNIGYGSSGERKQAYYESLTEDAVERDRQREQEGEEGEEQWQQKKRSRGLLED